MVTKSQSRLLFILQTPPENEHDDREHEVNTPPHDNSHYIAAEIPGSAREQTELSMRERFARMTSI